MLKQFNKRVALLHSPLTRNTKVVIIYLSERNQQGTEHACCPTEHRMAVTALGVPEETS